MTNKKRIWVFINVELYEEYKKIIEEEGIYPKNRLFKAIEEDIYKLEEQLINQEDINWCREFSKELIKPINIVYKNAYKRKVITCEDELFYSIKSYRGRGYNITAYINFALYYKIQNYKNKHKA